MDVICQAKSGMGKTAVFVLAVLQQIEPVDGEIHAVVLCHTRELAYQICHEFERFSVYRPDTKVGVIFGGVNVKQQKEMLEKECPHVIVGTPGRIKALAKDGALKLKHVRHFVLDECTTFFSSSSSPFSSFNQPTTFLCQLTQTYLFFLFANQVTKCSRHSTCARTFRRSSR